jgi:polysaccharide biosynthesis/export protein
VSKAFAEDANAKDVVNRTGAQARDSTKLFGNANLEDHMKCIRFLNLLPALAFLFALFSASAQALDTKDYTLGPGDQIRIVVFQNPDLTLDTRVGESGSITYPLIGSVDVGGLPLGKAEQKIAAALKKGTFVKEPQVNIVLVQVRGNQVSVLGQVNRPGRFPLETFNSRVSEMLAMAGGIQGGIGPNAGGADRIVVTGARSGKPFRKEIDIAQMYLENKPTEDIEVAAGDVIFVPSAPVYYIYGEVQRPGSFRIERGMTVQQALAQGGGPTIRGTERRLRVNRRNPDGTVIALNPQPYDPVHPNDVIFVRESLF